MRNVLLAGLALTLFAGAASASSLSGKYVEARTCDVWTGPCFANADFNLTGKNAVLAWRVDEGSFDAFLSDFRAKGPEPFTLDQLQPGGN